MLGGLRNSTACLQPADQGAAVRSAAAADGNRSGGSPPCRRSHMFPLLAGGAPHTMEQVLFVQKELDVSGPMAGTASAPPASTQPGRCCRRLLNPARAASPPCDPFPGRCSRSRHAAARAAGAAGSGGWATRSSAGAAAWWRRGRHWKCGWRTPPREAFFYFFSCCAISWAGLHVPPCWPSSANAWRRCPAGRRWIRRARRAPRCAPPSPPPPAAASCLAWHQCRRGRRTWRWSRRQTRRAILCCGWRTRPPSATPLWASLSPSAPPPLTSTWWVDGGWGCWRLGRACLLMGAGAQGVARTPARARGQRRLGTAAPAQSPSRLNASSPCLSLHPPRA